MPTTLANAYELSINLNGKMGTALYKGYGTTWELLPSVSFDSQYMYIEDYRLGFKLINNDYLMIGIFGEYNDLEFDRSDTENRAMKSLKNRHSTVLAGAEARVTTPIGMFMLSVAADVLGNSDGVVGEAAYGIAQQFGPVEIAAAGGFSWSDANYNNYYCGVSKKESLNSGLKSYAAGGGIVPFVAGAVTYSFDEHWDIFCRARFDFRNKAIRRSPMTVPYSTETTLAFGVGYNF